MDDLVVAVLPPQLTISITISPPNSAAQIADLLEECRKLDQHVQDRAAGLEWVHDTLAASGLPTAMYCPSCGSSDPARRKHLHGELSALCTSAWHPAGARPPAPRLSPQWQRNAALAACQRAVEAALPRIAAFKREEIAQDITERLSGMLARGPSPELRAEWAAADQRVLVAQAIRAQLEAWKGDPFSRDQDEMVTDMTDAVLQMLAGGPGQE